MWKKGVLSDTIPFLFSLTYSNQLLYKTLWWLCYLGHFSICQPHSSTFCILVFWVNHNNLASGMTINWFVNIKKMNDDNLRTNDNLSCSKTHSDRLYKIGPVKGHWKKSFSNIALSEKLCINEEIVPSIQRKILFKTL